MSKPIIEVKNLSKKYILGERQPYYSFRDTISGILHTPFHREKLQKDEFWALKDVSFDINQGDVVGVIGRNGAGKSTLLKILSQITPPTEGEVKLRGRVASLLEVGTGFHPELTGRENIYLNGAILGMKRWEINNKFKEIVEFSEIEKFLDTPVKHYSSGMYTRLAFSVAAHLEPEILLVDEVLAVGDTQFQQKCIEKMTAISNEGRTIIFVSHNLGAIKKLCPNSILLENGSLKKIDSTDSVIIEYLKNNGSSNLKLINKNNRKGNGKLIFSDINLFVNGKKIDSLMTGEKAEIKLGIINNSNKIQKNIDISVGVDNEYGERITTFSTKISGDKIPNILGSKDAIIEVNNLPLIGGRYNLTLFLAVDNEISDWIQNACQIEVENGKFNEKVQNIKGQGSIIINHSIYLK